MCRGSVGPSPIATVDRVMTAKEKLREAIETLSEQEAGEALRLLDMRADPVVAAFRDAPADDEPWTKEDEAEAAVGRSDLAAGRTVSLDDALREFE
jgi:hypothetical protein